MSRPLFVTHAPGDTERIFIVEQGGRIKILRQGVILVAPFLDLSSLVDPQGERGLLGLAFHPDYDQNGHFYVNYTDLGDDTVIARYKVLEANPDRADAGSETILLKIHQPAPSHNGGWLGFGSDGLLYIATGDGGDSFDTGVGHTMETGNAQDITDNLLGKILRIDVDGDDFPNDPMRNYAIAPLNPFVGIEGDDEIWLYGLRNPWRCSFDPLTSDLYIADVGQFDFEEIDVHLGGSAGGENYGWRCMEGPACTDLKGCTCNDPAWTTPIHSYSHEDVPFRCSITGGEIYRGCAIADLVGTYFFADFCSGQIWSFRFDGGTSISNFLERTAELRPERPLRITGISSFGRDAQGELYICDIDDGEVFKIVPRLPDSDPPAGAIDARQPFEPEGSLQQGWDRLTMTFSPCHFPVLAAEFEVNQFDGSDPTTTVPSVQSVTPLQNGLHLIVLSRSISVGAWTTLRHVPSGACTFLGRLPGDVTGDARSDENDIALLVSLLQGDIGPQNALSVWSTDLDGSGKTTPADLLRLIDLLAGAENFAEYRDTMLPSPPTDCGNP